MSNIDIWNWIENLICIKIEGFTFCILLPANIFKVKRKLFNFKPLDQYEQLIQHQTKQL